jgi:disulfide bond formation protein DsbB
MTRSVAVTLNALGLYAIALVLAAAFAAQLSLGELPCPLCLMQRIQFAMLAIGPVLNIRFGPRPSHYAVALLTAVAGAGFAMRQILLHITPGDPGYGSALLGYHYYSWAFIGFAVAIVLSAIMLLFDGQFTGQFTRADSGTADSGTSAAVGWFGRAAVWLVIVLVALNVISTLLECGFDACPDNPVTYRLLQSSH